MAYPTAAECRLASVTLDQTTLSANQFDNADSSNSMIERVSAKLNSAALTNGSIRFVARTFITYKNFSSGDFTSPVVGDKVRCYIVNTAQSQTAVYDYQEYIYTASGWVQLTTSTALQTTNVTAINTTGVASAAALVAGGRGGILTSTTGAAVTITTDTAAAIVAAISGAIAKGEVIVTIKNTGVTNAITLAFGSGVTNGGIAGDLTIAASGSASFRFVTTNVTGGTEAVVVYRMNA